MSDLTKENILIVHTRLLESYPKARCQGKVVRHSTKTQLEGLPLRFQKQTSSPVKYLLRKISRDHANYLQKSKLWPICLTKDLYLQF